MTGCTRPRDAVVTARLFQVPEVLPGVIWATPSTDLVIALRNLDRPGRNHSFLDLLHLKE